MILHTVQHEHFFHLFENTNIIYLVEGIFDLIIQVSLQLFLASWSLFLVFNNKWHIRVILFSWSLKRLYIITNLIIATYIIIFV